MEASYKKGRRSVDDYVEQTALSNTHCRVPYSPPGQETITYERAIHESPDEAKEIKPHPHGVELGRLMRMFQDSQDRHIASVSVPFTSESKEAITHYTEIVKELRLVLMEVGRRLGEHIRRGKGEAAGAKKRGHIDKFIPHIGIALCETLSLKDKETDRVVKNPRTVLGRKRTWFRAGSDPAAGWS